MNIATLFLISWRSIWRNKRRTIISISAISLGLSFAVFFLALGDGIYEQMIEDTVRMNGGHFTLEHPEYRDAPAIDLVVSDTHKIRKELEKQTGVRSTKALVIGQGLAKTGRASTGVAILGIEPSAESSTSPLAKRLVRGEYLTEQDKNKVVIGAKMAELLGLDIGKKIIIASSNKAGDMVEDLVRVKGIFKMGSPEIDGHMLQVNIDFARNFFGLDASQATQVGVVVEKPKWRDRVMSSYAARAPKDVAVLPWEQVLPDLANYVRLDRGSNQVFQGIIIFLCLFTIFNTILMSVLERTREFAVMLALGTGAARVRSQILIESAMLAFLGVFVGLAIGSAFAGYFQVVGVDMSQLVGEEMDVSGFALNTKVHAKLSFELLLALGASIFGATMLISLIAMRRIKQINLALVLR